MYKIPNYIVNYLVYLSIVFVNLTVYNIITARENTTKVAGAETIGTR